MKKCGLESLAINSDTTTMAKQSKGLDLFQDARREVTMILLSPEQLKSKSCERLLNDKEFGKRLCMVGVDEAHLINSWGSNFRKDFQQIGWTRSRLLNRVPTLAVTATLQVGEPTTQVCRTLGFQHGTHEIIRRSNLRADIRLLFRTFQSGLGGSCFPELDWVLSGRRRTLIFCATIALGYRVQRYFMHQASGDPDRNKRIRMFNALNHKSFNEATLTYCHSGATQIVVATSILSVGIDAPTFDDVIVFGEPNDTDELLQEFGRLRYRRAISPRGILYMTKNAAMKAAQVLAGGDQRDTDHKTRKVKNALRTSQSDTMQLSMAKLILADCKVAQLDELYGNNPDEPPCSCLVCQENPWPARLEECCCSGCQPEDVHKPEPRKLQHVMPRHHLSKGAKETATMRLVEWRDLAWERKDDNKWGFLPPEGFLPLHVIDTIVRNISMLKSVGDLIPFISTYEPISHLYHNLYSTITDIAEEIQVVQSGERAEACVRREQARISRMNKASSSACAVGEDLAMDQFDDPNIQRSGIKWRINTAYVIHYFTLHKLKELLATAEVRSRCLWSKRYIKPSGSVNS